MRWPVILGMAFGLFVSLPAQAAPTTEAARPRSALSVWDTGQPSTGPLSAPALAGKNEWTAIEPGKTTDSFQGNAVMSNGRIVAVLKKQDAAIEIHAVKPGGAVARFRLRLLNGSGEPAARLERMALVENTRAGACLEASFTTAKGTAVSGRFRIKRGDVVVQAEPGPGASKLRVECPGRFVVLPDFFADDITFDATKLPLASVELPSENFVLHPTGQGDAIAMCVFQNRQQDVQVHLAGTGEQRVVTGSDVGFEGKKIWVALMEAPRLWHSLELQAADTGKIMPLSWKMPFPAQWRVDFMRTGDLTDSWEMLLREPTGRDYIKPSWLGTGEERLSSNRRRWNTVLGRYPYPCWSDREGHGFLQPLQNKALQFIGPVVIYPINRVKQTPLDAYTVVDVMRNTLGVGPCEHILDLEGQKSEYKGRATCSVRDTLRPIYAKKQQKLMRDKVDQTLDEGLVFVKHIRGRITRYVEFGQKLRQYLAEQRKSHPEQSEFIDEMDRLTQEIDKRVAARADKIQTPAHVARMNEDFRKNVLDYQGPDAMERCRAYTEALVVIGDNQDELSAECRWALKTVRQCAGILMAMDAKVAPIAAEIRVRTQEALRNPASHEARH